MKPFIYRSIIFLSLCLFAFTSCKQSSERKNKTEIELQNDSENTDVAKLYPKLVFSKEIHKFGVVSEGEIVVCEFYFRNTGHANLVIQSIESSCGCTAVNWDKKPIKVGEESKIIVEFDSSGRQGKQYKVLTIFANTKRKVKELKISATVR